MFRPPKDYVYLDAVASAGSIRKAASRLHVASTSLNRKILEIEEELGMPLFERLPRGVRLTSTGEVILTAIRRNISDVETANAQMAEPEVAEVMAMEACLMRSASDLPKRYSHTAVA